MTPRRGFVLDLNKCTGCHACETACRIENALAAESRWRRVRTFNELHVHGVEVMHLSLACNHCAAAPCMDACPARAVHRDRTTGAVLIDEDTCIGCRYCAWACPYGAPRFNETHGVMTKCDLCVERLRAGREPACVTACPTGALGWGALPEAAPARNAPAGPIFTREVPGMTDVGADPSIRIVTLAPGRRAPRQTEPPAPPPWRAAAEHGDSQITLGSEWALAVFTLLTSALVGVFLATRIAASASKAGFPALGSGAEALFLALGAGALLLSASHLGRRMRAWRVALHADRSWLSREIVLFIAFFTLASLTFFLDAAFGWIAAALGGAALIAAGRVYRFARVRGGTPAHSAHLLLTGLLFAAAWAAAAWGGAQSGDATGAPSRAAAAAATTALAAIKAALYLVRMRNRRRIDFTIPAGLPALGGWTPLLRVALLAAGVAAVWLRASLAAAFALLLSAELIDRAEYYNEMETTSPESLMLEELSRRVEPPLSETTAKLER